MAKEDKPKTLSPDQQERLLFKELVGSRGWDLAHRLLLGLLEQAQASCLRSTLEGDQQKAFKQAARAQAFIDFNNMIVEFSEDAPKEADVED
jgi:hypothetical protein